MVPNFQVEPGLASWTCQAGLERRREQSFMRFSYFWSGQKFCKSSLSHDILALLLLVLPEAWRQSHVKTLMEKATSLNAFDLLLQPERFMFFLILYLCPAFLCRSKCFLTHASFLYCCKHAASHTA